MFFDVIVPAARLTLLNFASLLFNRFVTNIDIIIRYNSNKQVS